jgi:hypothetical protein
MRMFSLVQHESFTWLFCMSGKPAGAGDGFVLLCVYTLLHLAEVALAADRAGAGAGVHLTQEAAPSLAPNAPAPAPVVSPRNVHFAGVDTPATPAPVSATTTTATAATAAAVAAAAAAAVAGAAAATTQGLNARPLWLGYLCDAIGCLQVGLQLSAWNHHFRLLLLRLYLHPAIGALYPALTLYVG